MTTKELKTKLQALNISQVYGIQPQETAPPYIAYSAETANAISADGVVVFLASNVKLTFVSKKRDIATEKAIEEILTSNGVDFDNPEYSFDGNQKIHTVDYYFQTFD